MKKTLTAILLLIVMLASFAGFSACGKGDNDEVLTGFDIELATAAVQNMGLKVQFQPITWSEREILLNSGEIDLIWSGLTITEERQSTMQLSVPYLEAQQVAVIRKTDETLYKEKSDLEDAQIAVAVGSGGHTLLTGGELSVAKSNISEKENQRGVLTDLVTKGADVGIINRSAAEFYLNSNLPGNESYAEYSSKLMIAEIQLSDNTQYFGVAARKEDRALIDKVSTALAALYADGTYGALADKYRLSNDSRKEITYTSKWDDIRDKSGWDIIVERGTIVIGYLEFAPMVYAV